MRANPGCQRRNGPRVVLALVVAALALVLVGCQLGDGRYEVTIEFERTFNLFEGSKVRVLGIDVGTVRRLVVEPGRPTVLVTVAIDPGVDLPAEVHAVIVSAALLGERYVQLHPPYEGGPTLSGGDHVPLERTHAPAEFDEVWEAVDDLLVALDADEVGRLVTNLADVLDGQGESLGRTIDNTRDAIGALRDSDEQLVALASRLADLNETLATRDRQMGQLFEDWNVVAASLASDRADLDGALVGLARMTRSLGDVLVTHRERLEADIRTLTRVGRTAQRNLDEFQVLLEGQAELFRHADRVVNREKNWLPVINHTDDVPRMIGDRLQARLVGLCLRLEIDVCADDEFWEGELPDELCFEPIVPCPDPEAAQVVDALRLALDLVPEIGERLGEELPAPQDPLAPVPDLPVDDLGLDLRARVGVVVEGRWVR